MTTIDTHKTSIIKRILDIQNDNLLTLIDNLLNNFSKQEVVFTNENQKKSILQGLDDINNDVVYTQNEIDKIDMKWLSEK